MMLYRRIGQFIILLKGLLNCIEKDLILGLFEEPEVKVNGITVQLVTESKHGSAAKDQGIQHPGAFHLVQHLYFKDLMPFQDIHVVPAPFVSLEEIVGSFFSLDPCSACRYSWTKDLNHNGRAT